MEMFGHAGNMLWRSFHASLAGMGTTALGFVIPILVFVAVLILDLLGKPPGQSWQARIGPSLGVGLILGVIAWVVVYGFFVVATIYKDHITLVSERDTAQHTVKDREEQLAAERTKNTALVNEVTLLRQQNTRLVNHGQALERTRKQAAEIIAALISSGDTIKGHYTHATQFLRDAQSIEAAERQINDWRMRVGTALSAPPFNSQIRNAVLTSDGDLITEELRHLRKFLTEGVPDRFLVIAAAKQAS